MPRLATLAFIFALSGALAAQAPGTIKEYNDPDAPAPVADPAPAAQPQAEQKPAEKKIRDYSDAPAPVAPEPAKPAAPAAKPLPAQLSAREAEMRAVAERFAPVLHHRMAGNADQHRFDWPTSFDFDKDWVGNNNWEHAADPQFKLWCYVYYSVIESEDHYFIHYALFHPRDWSVVEPSYSGVLDTIQEQYKQIMGQKTREEVEFNHENDLEGALVIVDKWAQGGPRVVALETVAHNHLLRSIADDAAGLRLTNSQEPIPLLTEEGRPILYVESQKHGIHPLTSEVSEPDNPIVVLRYGKAVEFSQAKGATESTYELVSLPKTIWVQAKKATEPNTTFGTTFDFGDSFCKVEGAQRPACELGPIGDAFLGAYGRPNSAHGPWGWVDNDDKQLPQGAWFFDPIFILKRHFGLFDTRERYLYNPYLGIDRDTVRAPAHSE
ncbi:MAG TPA: hypothetical protein VLA96_10885 [Terriglobales bacterium]|nr:hypothetical protein [Terriglobales bacterium]